MRKRLTLSALAVALVVAAAVAAAATAGNGAHTPSVAALQHRVASLQAANQQLSDRYTPKGIARQLAKVKSALDKYRDVKVAKEAGYVMASACTMTTTDPGASWWSGTMGVHFMNPALLKPGPIDPLKPPILTYLPTASGGFELMAAEYFKPDADQNTKTDGDRPTLFGRAFDGPMLGHNPKMPIHYDLHVWLWKHNPSGLFAPWNPSVTCPK